MFSTRKSTPTGPGKAKGPEGAAQREPAQGLRMAPIKKGQGARGGGDFGSSSAPQEQNVSNTIAAFRRGGIAEAGPWHISVEEMLGPAPRGELMGGRKSNTVTSGFGERSLKGIGRGDSMDRFIPRVVRGRRSGGASHYSPSRK